MSSGMIESAGGHFGKNVMEEISVRRKIGMKIFMALGVMVLTLGGSLGHKADILAVNPYLPEWEHIPDGEPYVFADPDNPGKERLYIYGSHDTKRYAYC